MVDEDEFDETERLTSDRPPPSFPVEQLAIRFTGSGSEYFRIWIVNLLLILLTLGLYLPFARARRLAYFQNNTVIAGDPLGFHAQPWQMFRGYLVVLLLGLAYWVVSHFLPELSWVLLLVLAALWPALWRASLRFRLRNTSWRGVRLAFVGDLPSAYLCMLPYFAPALVVAVLMPQGASAGSFDAESAQRAALILGSTVLGLLALGPWLWARIKRYQHGGYAFAQERTTLKVGAGAFYLLFFKTLGVFLLCLIVAGVLLGTGLGLMASLGSFKLQDLSGIGGEHLAPLAAGIALLLVAYGLMPFVLLPYVSSRLQNLIWSNTRSAHISFRSQLRFGPLCRLGLMNGLLMLLTLGLYWPFAKVRVARLRLECVSLDVDGDINSWTATAASTGQAVLGDAAGDFFGIDLGL